MGRKGQGRQDGTGDQAIKNQEKKCSYCDKVDHVKSECRKEARADAEAASSNGRTRELAASDQSETSTEDTTAGADTTGTASSLTPLRMLTLHVFGLHGLAGSARGEVNTVLALSEMRYHCEVGSVQLLLCELGSVRELSITCNFGLVLVPVSYDSITNSSAIPFSGYPDGHEMRDS